MRKIQAKTYKIEANNRGETSITFSDEKGRELTVLIPTISVMGIAHQLRLAANRAIVPISTRKGLISRPVQGPRIPPPIEEQGGGALHSFGVSVTADFEKIETWFDGLNSEGKKIRQGFSMPEEDAAKLVIDLGTALEIVRSRPSKTKTKH